MVPRSLSLVEQAKSGKAEVVLLCLGLVLVLGGLKRRNTQSSTWPMGLKESLVFESHFPGSTMYCGPMNGTTDPSSCLRKRRSGTS